MGVGDTPKNIRKNLSDIAELRYNPKQILFRIPKKQQNLEEIIMNCPNILDLFTGQGYKRLRMVTPYIMVGLMIPAKQETILDTQLANMALLLLRVCRYEGSFKKVWEMSLQTLHQKLNGTESQRTP